jgi:hypothetical protein
MTIYAITEDYEAPYQYFANKVDAIRELGKNYDPDFHYIIEIEVK